MAFDLPIYDLSLVVVVHHQSVICDQNFYFLIHHFMIDIVLKPYFDSVLFFFECDKAASNNNWFIWNEYYPIV